MGTRGTDQNPSRSIPAQRRSPAENRYADDVGVDAGTALAQELAHLRAATETRETIAQAQGMLMARHSLSADAALALMVRLAQHSDTTLRDLATRLVATAGTGLQ